jgi:rfaE bifunctional protein nucleotidyltransferase chain/domain
MQESIREMGQTINREELLRLRDHWKSEEKRVVLAAGAFDLLHPGHIRLLEQARSLGNVLVVAIESDVHVGAAAAAASGSQRSAIPRPVTPASERAEIVAALAAVDFAIALDSISLEDWTALFRPDIFVVGGASSPFSGVEKLDSTGCSVLRIPLEPGYSTEALLERIQQLKQ